MSDRSDSEERRGKRKHSRDAATTKKVVRHQSPSKVLPSCRDLNKLHSKQPQSSLYSSNLTIASFSPPPARRSDRTKRISCPRSGPRRTRIATATTAAGLVPSPRNRSVNGPEIVGTTGEEIGPRTESTSSSISREPGTGRIGNGLDPPMTDKRIVAGSMRRSRGADGTTEVAGSESGSRRRSLVARR